MDNFVDDNGVSCFVDDNGVTCFVDDNGAQLCCGGENSNQILLGQACMSIAFCLLALV